ncbi:hypothetical protein ACFWD1_31895, partial [Micromonospora chalcea]
MAGEGFGLHLVPEYGNHAAQRTLPDQAGCSHGPGAPVPEPERFFRDNYAHQPPLFEEALGKQMLALLVQLE